MNTIPSNIYHAHSTHTQPNMTPERDPGKAADAAQKRRLLVRKINVRLTYPESVHYLQTSADDDDDFCETSLRKETVLCSVPRWSKANFAPLRQMCGIAESFAREHKPSKSLSKS